MLICYRQRVRLPDTTNTYGTGQSTTRAGPPALADRDRRVFGRPRCGRRPAAASDVQRVGSGWRALRAVAAAAVVAVVEEARPESWTRWSLVRDGGRRRRRPPPILMLTDNQLSPTRGGTAATSQEGRALSRNGQNSSDVITLIGRHGSIGIRAPQSSGSSGTRDELLGSPSETWYTRRTARTYCGRSTRPSYRRTAIATSAAEGAWTSLLADRGHDHQPPRAPAVRGLVSTLAMSANGKRWKRSSPPGVPRSLTNWPNGAFRIGLDHALHEASRDGSRFSSSISTISRPVNDTLGHDIGDQLLGRGRRRIASTLRPGGHGGAPRWGRISRSC